MQGPFWWKPVVCASCPGIFAHPTTILYCHQQVRLQSECCTANITSTLAQIRPTFRVSISHFLLFPSQLTSHRLSHSGLLPQTFKNFFKTSSLLHNFQTVRRTDSYPSTSTSRSTAQIDTHTVAITSTHTLPPSLAQSHHSPRSPITGIQDGSRSHHTADDPLRHPPCLAEFDSHSRPLRRRCELLRFRHVLPVLLPSARLDFSSQASAESRMLRPIPRHRHQPLPPPLARCIRRHEPGMRQTAGRIPLGARSAAISHFHQRHHLPPRPHAREQPLRRSGQCGLAHLAHLWTFS
ncbi:hypothetical protein EJ03DRAFT_194408 [Teratosphaeria nubilosa]|uniref:Uncharacterized protein n=1 Tax=Teratosphaeria nubilosa TaxID=161662 RepID=A0A6G1KZ63_9PEZI|nr:hypothetical protein EJ03DRAFT_194408 [Teratosphaeria nubilosa]